MQLHKEEDLEGGNVGDSSFGHIASNFYNIVTASLNHYRPLKTEDTEDEPVERRESVGMVPKNKWQQLGVPSVKGTMSALKEKMGTSQSEHEERMEWHSEDEENLNKVVESVRQSEASWRRREEVTAHEESKERSFVGHLWLVVQNFGLFRDSSYYRSEMHVIQRAIHNQMLKGPASAAKVPPPPPSLQLRRCDIRVFRCL